MAALTQQDFLDLIARLLPDWYVSSLKVPGPGYEALQAFAKLGERLSTAVDNFDVGAFIMSAMGGNLSTVTVEFYRPNAAAGAVTELAGTIVTTSKTGRDFVTTQDAVFGALALGPISATAVAVAEGWEWNVKGEVTTASGVVLPGEIDTIRLSYQSPAYGDPTVLVKQVADAVGGRAAMLDQLGADRGVPRANPQEADPAYRVRIKAIPDIITPDAIVRQVNAYMRPLVPGYDAAANFIETWSILYQTCWFDAPVVEGGAPQNQPSVPPITFGYDPNLFTYDDPRPSPPFRDRWLDEIEQRGTFIFLVPLLPAFADVGMAYDDTAMGPTDLITTTGRRAVGAYDVPVGLIASELQGGYDGFDLSKNAVYLGLFNLLASIKAAGVAFAIELENQ